MTMSQIARVLGVGRTTLQERLDLSPLDRIPREPAESQWQLRLFSEVQSAWLSGRQPDGASRRSGHDRALHRAGLTGRSGRRWRWPVREALSARQGLGFRGDPHVGDTPHEPAGAISAACGT
jgi:hypothetical protein